ncbi:phosphatidate cytidylyltransferase [Pseudorhizobium tarimense]|uniref:Phosphatidate cytidylyltransferase n=1 Tax=Pseudorhizobium tarimense TaxID=1079109 RepID=A0ABV2HAA5_9HYPH|nr:phosphatidate cytidylyltransferase [Pseudorhizobium tarimense]MCJ8520537.1 phosphatidate cytidylyltransferase [Pseudorhizobium tarimense]
MSPELQQRVLSGIVMAAVVLAATWFGGLPFQMLAAAIALLVYFEWSRITRLTERNFTGNLVAWVAVILLAANIAFGDPDMSMPLLSGFAITVALMVMIGGGTWWLPGGLLYAGLSGVSLAAVRQGGAPGLAAILFLFAVVWATDILAYFIGRALRGPKLAPRISPGKTWSGAIGGTVSAVIAGAALTLAFFGRVSLWIVVLAFILSVASQIGDLFESFIKRRFGVKDSSHMIPGHGGVMDRVDGLVCAGFVLFLLALVSGPLRGHVDVTVAEFLFGL